ncbi:hypothetical protein H5410_050604 [Solanum commersonii]|uniref:CCHC-type domain-containing protein n=1 Tax=Solanum commersonii TaxID=4109 RepID=A0A9J5WVX3_SOLCO|nr:hypothetical protein H5410_050604 [Solanum commersonii]
MLMYATICKSVKNTDRTIYKMIVASFTGQLRGWWDNYLNMEEKASIINAVATDDGVDNLRMALVRNKEDAVYTLVLTILEHFNGHFLWYKDTFLSRVMELPKTKVEYWKAKFIDDLPPLFAERVRKALRGSYGEIAYKDYTYGNIIGTCTQEGLNLFNELQITRQLKMDKLKEKFQLGDFYAQTEGSHKKMRSKRRSQEERKARKNSRKSHRFTKDTSGRDLSKVKCYKCGQLGHISPNYKLNKLKTLEIEGETYEKVFGLLYTSGSDDDYKSDSGSNIKLLDLSDNDKKCDNPCTTCQGITCNCEYDAIYKLKSQFQDFNMNTITSDNVIELLKEVTDSKLCEKIINFTTSNEASPSSSKPFENKKNDLNDFEYFAPYFLKEVDDCLIKSNAFPKRILLSMI